MFSKTTSHHSPNGIAFGIAELRYAGVPGLAEPASELALVAGARYENYMQIDLDPFPLVA